MRTFGSRNFESRTSDEVPLFQTTTPPPFQAALARLTSDHLKSITLFSGDCKRLVVCTMCDTCEATPHHLLSCVALTQDELFKRPYVVLGNAEGERTHGFKLIEIRRIRKRKRISAFRQLEHFKPWHI
ncbi:uncharacterized protein TNCV_5117421 [Trichonephila clavipes]|nr:uncharacterized protein TNCV_5117421 [Trichonephila clavipes]